MSVDSTDTEQKQTDARGGTLLRRVLAVAIPVAVLLVLFAVVLAVGVGPTPACSACHASQAHALAKTPHSGISCGSCHVPAGGMLSSGLDVAFRMVPASLGGVRLVEAGRPVGNSACVTCHSALVSGGVVKKNGLTINHTQCIASSPCENCHGSVMHGSAVRFVRSPTMSACIGCHAAQHATEACTACHAEQTAAAAAANPEWARTHGRNWKQTHGTGDLQSCGACHAADYCKTCHHLGYPHPADFGTTHGAVSQAVGVDACYTCHKQEEYCTGCHGMPMPHPVGFLQTHASAAVYVNNPRCAVCHPVDDCVECHLYHVHPGGVPSQSLPGGTK